MTSVVTASLNDKTNRTLSHDKLSIDDALENKIDEEMLANYTTLDDVSSLLAFKADVTVLTNDYVPTDNPESNLTESDRLDEEKHPREDVKINLTIETATSGEPVSWVAQTTMRGILDDKYELMTDSQNEIQHLTTKQANAVNSVFRVSNTYRTDYMQFLLYNEQSELTESVNLKGNLDGQPDSGAVYTKEALDVRTTDAKHESDDRSNAKTRCTNGYELRHTI